MSDPYAWNPIETVPADDDHRWGQILVVSKTGSLYLPFTWWRDHDGEIVFCDDACTFRDGAYWRLIELPQLEAGSE